MTIGQRIAQKRKELGLSQEGLGEQLGVSRQAIYKWESDSALPEIEKLVALSRSFGVSVGWLLGVEEEPAAGSGDLSENQLQMVKEIVDGYLTATPKTESPKKRRWLTVTGAAVILVLAVVLTSLFIHLNDLNGRYDALSDSINSIQNNVSSQIGSIPDQVEDILKSQNELTVDYSTELISVDTATGMATFSYRVVPKTYQPGMVAWIDILNDNARITYGPYTPDSQVFSGKFTIGLADKTSIYIVFEYGGICRTQLLDTYENLYSDNLPDT